MTAFVLAASLSSSRTASAADLDGERYAEPPYDEGAYGNEEYAPDRGDRDYSYDDRAPPEPPPG
jgi:hypothetical protein